MTVLEILGAIAEETRLERDAPDCDYVPSSVLPKEVESDRCRYFIPHHSIAGDFDFDD